MTWVELKFVRKFIVWQPNVSRHELIASQLYVGQICDLRELASRLANWPPIASSYALRSGFANLLRLASTCESVRPGFNIASQRNAVLCRCCYEHMIRKLTRKLGDY